MSKVSAPIVLLLLMLLSGLFACQSVGQATVYERESVTRQHPDGTASTTERERRAETRTPANPVVGGSATTGLVAADTGHAQATDQALAQLGSLTWIGAIIAAAGAASLLLRGAVPMLAVIPVGVSWGLLAFGGGLIALPMLLDRLLSPPVVVVVAAIGAFVLADMIGLLDNLKHRLGSSKSQSTPVHASQPTPVTEEPA